MCLLHVSCIADNFGIFHAHVDKCSRGVRRRPVFTCHLKGGVEVEGGGEEGVEGPQERAHSISVHPVPRTNTR